MKEMKNVGVREFRDHATTYLSGRDPIAINKHGKVIGYYVPVKRDQEAVNRAVDAWHAAVDDIITKSGMSEDELNEWLDEQSPFKT